MYSDPCLHFLNTSHLWSIEVLNFGKDYYLRFYERNLYLINRITKFLYFSRVFNVGLYNYVYNTLSASFSTLCVFVLIKYIISLLSWLWIFVINHIWLHLIFDYILWIQSLILHFKKHFTCLYIYKCLWCSQLYVFLSLMMEERHLCV